MNSSIRKEEELLSRLRSMPSSLNDALRATITTTMSRRRNQSLTTLDISAIADAILALPPQRSDARGDVVADGSKAWQSNIADALDFLEASALIRDNAFNVPEIAAHNEQVARFAELIRPHVFGGGPPLPGRDAISEGERDALEQIALLDEADGHELTREHALQAVAIATSTLGKHPSQILSERASRAGDR